MFTLNKYFAGVPISRRKEHIIFDLMVELNEHIIPFDVSYSYKIKRYQNICIVEPATKQSNKLREKKNM